MAVCSSAQSRSCGSEPFSFDLVVQTWHVAHHGDPSPPGQRPRAAPSGRARYAPLTGTSSRRPAHHRAAMPHPGWTAAPGVSCQGSVARRRKRFAGRLGYRGNECASVGMTGRSMTCRGGPSLDDRSQCMPRCDPRSAGGGNVMRDVEEGDAMIRCRPLSKLRISTRDGHPPSKPARRPRCSPGSNQRAGDPTRCR